MGLKLQGNIELSEKEIEKIINQYVLDKYGVPVTSVEFRKDKILAHVNHVVSEGEIRKPVAPSMPRRQKVTNEKKPKVEGFKHKWSGLYGAVADIVENQRKRKKKYISFEDLMAELLEVRDPGGKNKLFVKPDGETLPMSALKQRLATSQLKRQVKTQPKLKGLVYDRSGLKL